MGGLGRDRAGPAPPLAARGARPGPAAARRTPAGALAAQARLLAAAVPATALGHGAADWARPGGAAAAAATGAAAIACVFLVLARPLRLDGIDALVTGAAARLRRRAP